MKILLALTAVAAAADGQKDYVLRWASSGGGWRSMMASFAYASVFANIGLLSETGSVFSGISGTSGGSWCTSQLFYSPPIYKAILETAGNASAVADFVTTWMDAYLKIQKKAQFIQECGPLANLTNISAFDDVVELCEFLIHYESDWARFVEDMLRATTKAFGDNGFERRLASPGNRVAALQETDLLVQMTLAPNLRIRRDNASDVISYLAPAVGRQYYAVSLGAVFTVKSNTTLYRYSVKPQEVPFATSTGLAPDEFDRETFDNFYLYTPNSLGIVEGRSVFTTLDNVNMTASNFFREPFGGANATIIIAPVAASSAAAGQISGSNPSVWAQMISSVSESVRQSNASTGTRAALQIALDIAANGIYQQPVFDKFGVCSQWPHDCTEQDGHFNDGAFSDNLAVAMNIGEYHVDGGDLNKTMKFIIANNNVWYSNNVHVLSLFSAPFNQGIAPGDWIWAPAASPSIVAQTTPWRSIQCFQEFMDDETLLSAFEPIEGTNLTTAVYNATTTENAAMGIKAGQKVELLLLQINSNVPTVVIGTDATTKNTPLLSEMAAEIAGSAELQRRIATFLELSETAPTVSPAVPPMPPPIGSSAPTPSDTRLPESGARISRVLGSFALWVLLAVLTSEL